MYTHHYVTVGVSHRSVHSQNCDTSAMVGQTTLIHLRSLTVVMKV